MPASVNPLVQEFHDDAGEELDIRRDMDEVPVKVITCEVGPSLFADVEAISRKGAAKVTKKEHSQKYSNFYSLPKFVNKYLTYRFSQA